MASSVQGNRLTSGNKKKWFIAGAAIIALLTAIAIDTTVVTIGSDQDARQQAFSADNFGRGEFPRIQKFVLENAVDATKLASQLAVDKKSTIEKFATVAGVFPIFPLRFVGVADEGKSGIFTIAVEGMPEGAKIRVQSGPAINGTELRDVTGDIEFGAFKNQIEYQNVGAGINKAMSAEILSTLDRESLKGKTVTIVGAFKMINPKNWLVTPVEFTVQ
ncbi:MAG: DUF2291 domain-containing protein [Hyphomicrobiales bacterium]